MLKIGIITQPLRLNYGGLLQNYALQTVLQRMGHHVVTLDSPYKLSSPTIFVYVKRLIKKIILRRISTIFLEQEYEKKRYLISLNTSLFINQYINRVEVKKYKLLENKYFDVLIVGSDQVWRPKYNENIKDCFLYFARKWKVKRLAYAASFGTSDWEFSSSLEKDCRNLAQLFDAISVREDSGVDLCKQKLLVKAQHVLDPTMLLTKEDYNKVINNSETEVCPGNFFCYILDESARKREIVQEMSTRLNLKPFSIEIDNFYKPDVKPQPKVEQWLRGFRDADFIITDSFHACVFSIIYGKSFYVIANQDRGLSRISSLLKTFGLENRLITEVQDLNKLNFSLIDYSSIDYKLENMKRKSYSFITNSLSEMV